MFFFIFLFQIYCLCPDDFNPIFLCESYQQNVITGFSSNNYTEAELSIPKNCPQVVFVSHVELPSVRNLTFEIGSNLSILPNPQFFLHLPSLVSISFFPLSIILIPLDSFSSSTLSTLTPFGYESEDGTLQISPTIVRIDSFAFQSTQIKKIVFLSNSSLKYIDIYAFSSSSKLSEVFGWPKSLPLIFQGMFSSSFSLSNFSFEGSPFQSGVLEIPPWISEIYHQSFNNTAFIKIVFTLSGRLQRIYENAFSFSSKLLEVLHWPSHVPMFSSKIFSSCPFLSTFSFENSTPLEGVLDIPYWIVSIGYQSFSATAFSKLVFEESSRVEIDNEAFSTSSKLSEVSNWPESLSSIPSNIFSSCLSLYKFSFHSFDSEPYTLQIPIWILEIKSQSFSGTAFQKLIFDEDSKLNFVGNFAFQGCFNLYMILHWPLRLIDSGIFSDCSKLQTFSYGNLNHSQGIFLGQITTVRDSVFNVNNTFQCVYKFDRAYIQIEENNIGLTGIIGTWCDESVFPYQLLLEIIIPIFVLIVVCIFIFYLIHKRKLRNQQDTILKSTDSNLLQIYT